METNPPAIPFLLLFRNTGPENYQNLSPDQRQHVVAQWNAWFDGLVADGKAVEGQPLEPERRVVAGATARVTDGPFAEAKEVVGGYVKLLVRDMEEATAIARRHPGLAHGLVIEIREMTPHCHLGVNTRAAETAAVAGR